MHLINAIIHCANCERELSCVSRTENANTKFRIHEHYRCAINFFDTFSYRRRHSVCVCRLSAAYPNRHATDYGNTLTKAINKSRNVYTHEIVSLSQTHSPTECGDSGCRSRISSTVAIICSKIGAAGRRKCERELACAHRRHFSTRISRKINSVGAQVAGIKIEQRIFYRIFPRREK